jgi:hypothetical protein
MATDRELSVRQRELAEAHLAECVTCRERRACLSAVADLFDVRSRSTPDAEWVERERTRLRHKLKQMPPLPRPLAPGPAHVTATAVLGMTSAAAVVFAAALFFRGALPSERVISSTAPPATETTMLPVAGLTPGATWDVTMEELCADRRHEQRPVPDVLRARVLNDYGMAHVPPTEYELDYLIAPALGGAADAKNLWPQRYDSTSWNPFVKDQLERVLPAMVCGGAVPLETAQRDIAANWIAAYKKYFRTSVPLLTHSAVASSTDPSGDEPLLYPVWRHGGAPSLRLIAFSPSSGF